MNDPLFGNKLAAAGLVALLLFFGLPQLANGLLGGGHHGPHSGELHLAYPIAFQTAGGADETEAAADLGTLLAAATAAAGERRAAICKSCHTLEQGGANGTGPNLWDIIGRPVAATAGYRYTDALKAFGGEWSYERLDGYLENSATYVPGTAMNQRFPKPEHRAEILVYLSTLSGSPEPFPEPAPHGGDHAEGAAH